VLDHVDAQIIAGVDAEIRPVLVAQGQTLQLFDLAQRRVLGALDFGDFEDAEEKVRSAFNRIQQSAIIEMFDNAPEVVYALAQAPKKLAELAAIQSPFKFAAALAETARGVKVERKTVKPETKVNGNGKAPVTSVANQATLLERARKSGDYTEYNRARWGQANPN
jgi:hypothetical protein